jgi:hypothetical protein
MRVNSRAVLEDCLEKAVMHALRNIDDALTDTQIRQLERKLETEMWLQLDTYFDFDEVAKTSDSEMKHEILEISDIVQSFVDENYAN